MAYGTIAELAYGPPESRELGQLAGLTTPEVAEALESSALRFDGRRLQVHQVVMAKLARAPTLVEPPTLESNSTNRWSVDRDWLTHEQSLTELSAAGACFSMCGS